MPSVGVGPGVTSPAPPGTVGPTAADVRAKDPLVTVSEVFCGGGKALPGRILLLVRAATHECAAERPCWRWRSKRGHGHGENPNSAAIGLYPTDPTAAPTVSAAQSGCPTRAGHPQLVPFVASGVRAGPDDGKCDRRSPSKAFPSQGATQQQRQACVLGCVQGFVPHQRRECRQRIGFRREVENQRGIEDRRHPQVRPSNHGPGRRAHVVNIALGLDLWSVATKVLKVVGF